MDGNSNTEDAVRAAWQTLTGTDLLTANTNETADNSKIIIGHGAYLQIGKEKLVFDEKDGDCTIDNISTAEGLSAAVNTIKEHAQLTTDAAPAEKKYRDLSAKGKCTADQQFQRNTEKETCIPEAM